MAARLNRPTPSRFSGAEGRADSVLTAARPVILLVSVALLLLVGISEPNAAQPDLGPSGWAPGPLVPLTLGAGAVTGVLWTAYLLAGVGVLIGLRSRPPALRSWLLPGGLAAATLLVAPFGSADHVNYLAYGRILVGGGDPWVEAPVEWAGGLDPITSRVEEPWTTEPSVYGPFGTMLHGLSSWLGGDSLREGVWVWQVLVVLAWLAIRWLLRRTLAEPLHGRVDVLWTLNPLVLGVGVLGAHIDMVAVGLAVAAVALASRGGWPWAAASGAAVGLAGSTKFTYAVVAAGIVAAWWVVGQRRARLAGLVAGLAVGFVVVAGVLQHWAGPHVYDQLQRSRRAVSLATPWRVVLETLGPVVGFGQTRELISIGAALLAVVLAVGLLLVSRPAATRPAGPSVDPGTGPSIGVVALWVTGCLALAFSLAAPYSLPWYDVLVWAALPAVASGLVDGVALVRLTALAVAYVPGRVLGMSAEVEDLTLGLRRGVAPWVVVLLWLVVIGAGARTVWRQRRGPRPGGRTPSPTR